MTYIEDDLLPTRNEVGTGARLQVTDGLAGTPTTVNGPTITTTLATLRAAIGGHEVGDTGWRDVAADLENGWTAGALLLRREGSLVQLASNTLNRSAATEDRFYTLPTGYGIFGGCRFLSVDPTAPDQPVVLIVAGTGAVSATRSQITGNTVQYVISWFTDDPWPTTLPGTPS